jgi:hypothetical protein
MASRPVTGGALRPSTHIQPALTLLLAAAISAAPVVTLLALQDRVTEAVQ